MPAVRGMTGAKLIASLSKKNSPLTWVPVASVSFNAAVGGGATLRALEKRRTIRTPELTSTAFWAGKLSVTVIVVFAFGASGNAGIVNVPVVSLVGLVCTATDDVIVDGSMFTYVPVTSIVDAPVCVPGSGDVIESRGGSLKYFTRTLAVP